MLMFIILFIIAFVNVGLGLGLSLSLYLYTICRTVAPDFLLGLNQSFQPSELGVDRGFSCKQEHII